jgi:hypothetical protein
MRLQSDVATGASAVLHRGFHEPEYRVHCGENRPGMMMIEAG